MKTGWSSCIELSGKATPTIRGMTRSHKSKKHCACGAHSQKQNRNESKNRKRWNENKLKETKNETNECN